MLTSSEKSTLRKKLDQYEGTVPHMYLDSKGYVTVGTGHLLSSVASAQKLSFVHAKTGKAATAEEIKDEFENVKKQAKNRLASYYKKFTSLKLKKADIDRLTNQHITTFHKELKKIYPEFGRYPSEVRLALFDMIFNLGMTNLKNKWPSFNKYIKAKDWANAALQSKRKPPVSAARNQYVKGLLEIAAKNAVAKTKP